MPRQLPPFSDRLTIPGFSLGHGTDLAGKTGVTVVLVPEGAVAAADVRGSATGTRQFDSLVHPGHVARRAHAVVLAGGSGGGLAAADPVVAHLAAAGAGFVTGYGPVPLVPTAILFDLAFGDPAARPTPALGAAALADATARGPDEPVPIGSIGAGTGATVGKALGPAQGMKGGFGFAATTVPGGPTVAAAVAVNALGDVRDPDDGRLLAGCRTAPDSLELASAEAVLAHLPPELDHPWEGNTTLAVVMTDAALDKLEAGHVCRMAFGALHRTLAPALTRYDGDLVVTLARGPRPANLHQIGVLAERCLARAVVRAVSAADGLGLLPAARDLAGGGR